MRKAKYSIGQDLFFIDGDEILHFKVLDIIRDDDEWQYYLRSDLTPTSYETWTTSQDFIDDYFYEDYESAVFTLC